jgi:aldehyde dehydrogenase (NAD+)
MNTEREDQLQICLKKMREFFDSGYTKSYDFRIEQLKKLKRMIKNNEKEISKALYLDLHKPEFEAYTSEIGVIYAEINEAVKGLKGWMKPKKAATPLVLQPSTSVIYKEPLGLILIIGPWNYPFQLLLAPLVGAIAAGNCAIIKPSDQTINVSNLMVELIGETFENNYVSVVQGPGATIGAMLLERIKFDHIFFTGSSGVGKKIAEIAARSLTPVTLELGGKSPVIVDRDANIKVTAKRLVWAKFFNSGQTCVCPDYLLVHEEIKDVLIEKMKDSIRSYFGEDPSQSESYGRIVNSKRVEALKKLMNSGRIICGGRIDDEMKYIEPTLIDNVTLEDPIMQEEIFGPLLPILAFSSLGEVVKIIRKNRYPLALYLFTECKATENFIIENVEFGGGCINNGMVHLINSELPFGGVGNSGMGQYHGKYSFDTFSHIKSIVKTRSFLDPNIRYAPYTASKLNIVKRFME